MKFYLPKIRLNKSGIKLFLLLLPVFRPTCMTLYESTLILYNMLTMVVFIYLCLDYVLKSNFDKFTCIVFGLEMWMFIVTFFTNGERGTALYRLETITILLLVLKKYSGHWRLVINTLMLHFELCIYINFITMLIRPQGFFDYVSAVYSSVGIETKYWFLGVANNFIIWFVPGIMVAWLYRILNKKNTRCYLLILVIFLSMLIRNSATCMVGCCIEVLLLFIAENFPRIRKIMKPKLIMTGLIILFILIVVIQRSDFLEPIVEGILGKDMTFTNRLVIWENAISAFINNPIIGHGIMNNTDASEILGRFPRYIWKGATHCHDEILQIMFCGGVIGLSLYIMMWVLSMKKISKNFYYGGTKIIFYGCLAVFVVGITEVTEYALLYLPIFVGYWLSDKFDSVSTGHL